MIEKLLQRNFATRFCSCDAVFLWITLGICFAEFIIWWKQWFSLFTCLHLPFGYQISKNYTLHAKDDKRLIGWVPFYLLNTSFLLPVRLCRNWIFFLDLQGFLIKKSITSARSSRPFIQQPFRVFGIIQPPFIKLALAHDQTDYIVSTKPRVIEAKIQSKRKAQEITKYRKAIGSSESNSSLRIMQNIDGNLVKSKRQLLQGTARLYYYSLYHYLLLLLSTVLSYCL